MSASFELSLRVRGQTGRAFVYRHDRYGEAPGHRKQPYSPPAELPGCRTLVEVRHAWLEERQPFGRARHRASIVQTARSKDEAAGSAEGAASAFPHRRSRAFIPPFQIDLSPQTSSTRMK